MRKTNILYGLFLFSNLLLIASRSANAQKLPAIQQGSMRAPDNIRIDGKATEWGNKLQAYNPVNIIFYSIANDDKNLYLIIHAPDLQAIGKIGSGGITFTISALSDKKLRAKATDNISVKYPVINLLKSSGMDNAARQYQDLKKDTLTNKHAIDSLTASSNKRINMLFKEIQVRGIKQIKDPLISIYNTEGIKAMGMFNSKMAYVYELAIPLKYLGHAINNTSKLSYNIKLNGMPSPEDWAKVNKFPPPIISRDDGNVSFDFEYLNNPTDFWGEYTLAKK